MDSHSQHNLLLTRRQLFGRATTGIGIAALGSLLEDDLCAMPKGPDDRPIDLRSGGRADLPHFAPKAGRVIYLFQSGAPSQIDLFDYKPMLSKFHGQELPDSVRQGQRITGMTSGQESLPVASSIFKFNQHGQSGRWLSELIPHQGKIVADVAYIKTIHTDAINHDPAITFIQSGFQQPGRPSMGAWMSYGLGSENQNLPGFVVLVSQKNSLNNAQPLFSRLWGAGFLPSRYQGVRFRSSGDPVLYLSDPPGVSRKSRRSMLDSLAELNNMRSEAFGDPEIDTRIAQYEMAYRMQTSVPELMDLSDEPDHIFDLYGPDSRKPGTYAANCLLARRLAERDVRFVQLFHRGWDQHNDLPRDIALQSNSTDQPSAALVQDLKQRGMLDDTLVIWGGGIRPHRLLPRRAYRHQLRTRSPPPLLHYLDGRRWRQTRHQHRRNRRLLLQHRQRPRPHPRPPSHHTPSHGHRPQEAHLQVSRPPFPPHRRSRQLGRTTLGIGQLRLLTELPLNKS